MASPALTQPSYSSSMADKPLLGMTIGDKFDQIATQHADNDALIVLHQNIHWSYRQLQEEVNRCARALLSIGVKKGDRVAIWAPNCSEWTLTQFATAKIGAILVNINPSYRTHELEYALNQSGARFLVTANSFKSSDYSAMLYELAPELKTSNDGELKSQKLPDLECIINLSSEKLSGMWRWSDLMKEANKVSQTDVDDLQATLQFDDAINIQYTSGTTGFPKGATLSHHNILNNGFFVAESMGFTSEDRLVIPVPLYHCFGMVMGNLGCMTHGATMIYPDEGFDPGKVLKAVHDQKATALYGVPTMFIAELEHEGFASTDFSTLRTGIMAGSICPAEIMKQVINKMNMKGVQIAYGMTETSPVSTQTGANDSIEKRVSTVGRTQPHLENKIVDPGNGGILPRGEIGELCTRGYSVMLKYWNNDKATAEAIDEAGWMHTGDLATMDEEGYIQIVGRIKDMVIRGGENVYPKEIEEFLYAHPAISEVQVTGVPDKKYGEELIAWVKLNSTAGDVTGEELREYCKGKITHFKIPRYFKFVDEFPMTVTGKIQKFKMREISIQELGLDQES
ncbi:MULTISPECIES: AMP-binding protein [Halomonadaceae]|jgi:fatty-acyl-CoA synthase|uniref:3-[(3aS,4S,7aS)-7a-methyl-1, 5-dioxo-octahydro-1H-inden-4-yl]propanoyl:CoA ligase n=1 Tax=Vreelandella titanicae TaxID=664683 RepID=A0A653QBI9_9GAMM|nr:MULTISPECIES: AMP-binding protein [Halomonas]QKS23144.1 3-[(3aS,4S,7aS)-7a-methyl-1,5-dioxo-octahydro-1H-inden-4-yl]propanoyl:CoA ligase [Halomonas titanicae]CAD5262006.1 putative acyl-CoA synthetase YngI [Halomonas sp. 156]CAD5286911.1 putative acyl-CoA synthetase YngI [Halomonas sp. 113]CAD5288486.1 putative acyl-CoA synthetase YngI [Halomonas sp. 59]CAD5291485.1 Putative acyl-CoA synthetase YngI [Halomonas sp. I3]